MHDDRTKKEEEMKRYTFLSKWDTFIRYIEQKLDQFCITFPQIFCIYNKHVKFSQMVEILEQHNV